MNGSIDNGTEAEFYVDIPPFSNREFAMRMRLASGSPTVKIDNVKFANGRLENLSLTVEGIKPQETQVHVLFGNRFYALTWQNGVWKQSADVGDASAMLKLQNMQQWANNSNFGFDSYGHTQTPQERFNLMMTPLLSRSLNVTRETDAEAVRVSPDLIRVFLYTKTPPEFAVQNSKLGAQQGYVLYCLDVPLQEK